MNAFLVLTPGSCTTVQDLGRLGYRHLGVPVSGALDGFACRAANRLVGNPDEAAVLEMTVTGPHLAVLTQTVVALAGADMGATLNHRPVDNWSALSVSAGDVLAVNQVRSGCRGYLAVAGGIDVPVVMGSRSTCLGAALGGLAGRVLQKGDFVPGGGVRAPGALARIPEAHRPRYDGQAVLRAVPGPQDWVFSREAHRRFFGDPFTVSPRTDRMGCRLEGPVIRPREGLRAEMVSEAVVSGTVQVPPDGMPLVLLVEQTVGGYAKIATIVSSDLPRLAQTIPGDTVRFEKVSVAQAHQLAARQARRLDDLLP
jgi:antagonist of KipI